MIQTVMKLILSFIRTFTSPKICKFSCLKNSCILVSERRERREGGEKEERERRGEKMKEERNERRKDRGKKRGEKIVEKRGKKRKKRKERKREGEAYYKMGLQQFVRILGVGDQPGVV